MGHNKSVLNGSRLSEVDTDNPIFLAFILYDGLITFDREVKVFWTRKMSGASALYFSIKFTVIVYCILRLAAVGGKVRWELSIALGVVS